MSQAALALHTALLQLQSQAAASAAQAQAYKKQAQAQLGQRSSPHLQPSGPRAKGDGVEDDVQAILCAQPTPGGGVVLRVTLLAAGFLVGPSGASIRQVCEASHADIKSFTTDWAGRRVREMSVQGEPHAVVRALHIISSAVARYAELTSGAFAALAVDREQLIHGCTFYYQPPPRAAVPFAAALRSAQERPASPPATRKPFGVSPTVPPSAGKENRLGAALLAAQAAQGLQAHPVRGGSGAHPPPAAGVLSPRLGLATPVAPRSGGGSGRLLTALSGVSVGMEMEGEEAGTPAYFTSVSGGFAAGAPFAASPAAPPAPAAYSLWGGGVGGAPLGLSAQQLDPFAAPASAFASAWEVAATPAPRAAAAPLSRAASASEDALRAASGFLPPPYSAFAQQSSFYQPALFAHQPTAPTAAPPLAPGHLHLPVTPAVALPGQMHPVGIMPGWPHLY